MIDEKMEKSVMDDEMEDAGYNVETEEDGESKSGLITTERTKGHIQDISPGTLAVELPAGYIYEGNVQVDAIVREMRGHEEDILASKGSIVVKLNAIIGNCLVQLGVIGDRLELIRASSAFTAQDRMAVLLAIRRVSLGDFYDCTVTCPECKVSQHKTLDLKEIEIIPMPDRMKRVREVTLPSGTDVTWHVINSDDEEWLTTQRKKKQDQLTLGLLARVDVVGSMALNRDKEYKKAMRVLKDLSMRDRNFLRDRFDKEEGKIDTDVEFSCEDCGHEWQGKMDIGQASFFFPSA